MVKFREINALIVLLILWYTDAKIENESRQNVILHETVRTLLGFKETPSRESNIMPRPPNPGEDAPKYMMDLYEKFKSGSISKGKLSGNTVRSIQAETAEVNGEAMFVFNLTSIVTSEEMISAEIHLYKRKQTLRRRNLDIELLIYEIAPHYISQTSKITMRAGSFGWQSFDVTEGVKSCLAARRDHPNMFALKFRSEKPNGKHTILALKKFMHHHSVPYLIVYSNDTENISLEKLDKLTESYKAVTNADKDENASGSSSQRSKRDLSGVSTDGTFRKSRSLFTNEIPEDPNDYRKYAFGFNMPQTHPGMLQARKEQKHRPSDSRLIPYPNSSTNIKNGRKWKRRQKNTQNRKNRNKKNKQELPFKWDDYHDNMATEENSGRLCSKKKLIVDFHDIGWGEWIISPKSFEAHYCSGSCPFPLTKAQYLSLQTFSSDNLQQNESAPFKLSTDLSDILQVGVVKLRPSNHATIQSIVNAIGIYADVPAPCCVPDSLSSLTLLYFDENRNVVLKNYPGMTVQTCACR